MLFRSPAAARTLSKTGNVRVGTKIPDEHFELGQNGLDVLHYEGWRDAEEVMIVARLACGTVPGGFGLPLVTLFACVSDLARCLPQKPQPRSGIAEEQIPSGRKAELASEFRQPMLVRQAVSECLRNGERAAWS